MAAGWLTLLAVTWPLWTPQTRFPAIPWFGFLTEAPAALDWVCLAGMIGGLAVLLIRPACGAWPWWLVMTAAMVSISLDQDRLQPWAYQFVLMGWVIAGGRDPARTNLLRMLALSIYFYSALSKLNQPFVVGLGRLFLEAGSELVGLQGEAWPESLRWMSLLFPLGELLVFALLAAGWWRWRGALIAGIGLGTVMHLGLLLLVGPWGLNHSWGVLLWNLFFIGQLFFLFGRVEPAHALEGKPLDRLGSLRRAAPLPLLVTSLAILLPMLEPLGYFDHWPAWALYSSHVSQAELILPEYTLERLPPEIRSHAIPVDDAGTRYRLDLGGWSLRELGVPAYPQARFELAAGLATVDRQQLRRFSQVILSGPAGRISGTRRIATFRTPVELQRAEDAYWFNTRPRRIWREAADH
ncbi:MAG: hypothetical protein WD045_07475 [Pirellulaceae bacterium]